MRIRVRTQSIAIATVVLLIIVTAAISLSRQTSNAVTGLPPGPFSGIDDVQYFPGVPDNKLANETARLKVTRTKMQVDER